MAGTTNWKGQMGPTTGNFDFLWDIFSPGTIFFLAVLFDFSIYLNDKIKAEEKRKINQ